MKYLMSMKKKFAYFAIASLMLAVGCSKQNANYNLEHALQMKDKIYTLYDVDETPLLAENYPQDVAAEATYLAEGADNKVNKYSYLWPYSGTLSMMSALYEATHDETILTTIDEQVVEGLKMYHDTSREPHGYSSYITADETDRFYDDNIWLVIDFVDLYTLTGKQSYLDMALDIWKFVLSGRDTKLGDGIYWCEQKKTTKNTCSNAPAAVAALKLHKATGEQQYFDQGENLYTWVYYSLRDKDNLYWDNVSLTGKFDRRKFTYNSGQMIEAGVLLYEITKEEKYLKQAQATAESCLAQWSIAYKNDKGDSITIFESGDVWFDAVLMRGYMALWRADGEPKYLTAFNDTINYAWYMGRDENGLFGKYLTSRGENEDKSWLLTQAAYAEMSARLATVDLKNAPVAATAEEAEAEAEAEVVE